MVNFRCRKKQNLLTSPGLDFQVPRPSTGISCPLLRVFEVARRFSADIFLDEIFLEICSFETEFTVRMPPGFNDTNKVVKCAKG